MPRLRYTATEVGIHRLKPGRTYRAYSDFFLNVHQSRVKFPVPRQAAAGGSMAATLHI